MDLHIVGAPIAMAPVTLEQSLNCGWIEFWYQPKIDLRSGQIVGVEAFARVRHPTQGILKPGDFMRDAERKSIVALSELALAKALKASTIFSMLGGRFPVALNMSISTLRELRLSALMREHRSEADTCPGIIFDITEEQVVDNIPLIRELARELESHGISIAIDDFGHGLTSLILDRYATWQRELDGLVHRLVRLKEMRFAELKIDRILATRCGVDDRAGAICKTVIDLAHHFRSVVVGIGIEKAATAASLQKVGCDIGQGFLFGEPLPLEEFVAFLRDWRHRSPKGMPARCHSSDQGRP